MIRAGLLTVADAALASADEDEGQILGRIWPDLILLQQTPVADSRNLVEEILRRWADEEELDLIVTVGGTRPAVGPMDVETAPEATTAVVERLLPGIPESMRIRAAPRFAHAPLDRSIAGIRGRTLIVNVADGALGRFYLDQMGELCRQVLSILETPQPSSPKPRDSTLRRRPLDEAEFTRFLRSRRSPKT